MGAPAWPHMALPLPCWPELINTLPGNAWPWAGDSICSKQAVQLRPHSFGEAGEERRGISSHAVLLGPGAGERFPAGSADWQGCSHQRPPTTYLKLFLFHKASSPLGRSGCVWLGYESQRLSPQPAELLCPPELASITFNSLNSLD